MNSNLESFIRDARTIAEQRGVDWEVQLGPDGIAPKGKGWNLTQMAHAAPPPVNWLNDFGTDQRTVEVLSSSPPPGPVRTYSKKPLSSHWQDLIKASALDQLFVRRNTCSHVANNVVRSLRVLATCVANTEPWAVTVDDVAFAMDTARKVQPSGKLSDLIFGVVRSVLDANHLTDNSPLTPLLERDKKIHVRTSKFTKSMADLRTDLEERKHSEKLPERRAFWELVRIVFTETPKSFLDLLRFAQTKTLILTGLRDGECNLLPADWKRYREYFDFADRSAGQAGGISRSLMLRHFAEKQRVLYEDSIALFETVQHVPQVFEEALTSTLTQVVTVTEPLRKTIRGQIETGRILSQFEKGDLVRVLELYTYLTGNPFVTETPKVVRERWVAAYRNDYNPKIFDDLRADQLRTISAGKVLASATYLYLRRFKGPPFRTATGAVWTGNKIWNDIYLRVGEVEEFLNNELPTKRSDTSPIKLSNGELSAWELLFLMPKRALAEGRDAGLCDVTRYCSVGRMDRNMIIHALSSGEKPTLFATYGQTDEDRGLTLRPHSLRHLQNTELFRLGIADTIITKRFNRKSVTQSYDYDHRSLAEELDQVDLKPEVEVRLGEKSATIARLIKAGKAHGPIVDAFRKIQLTGGEDAAIEYLRAEADGFHSTPYGHCINSFTVDACPKHLECFTGCKHLTATDLSQNRLNLVQLESRLEVAVHAIESRKSNVIGHRPQQLETQEELSGMLEVATHSIEARSFTSVGLDNQLTHAKVRLAGIRKLLGTAPGQVVFPDGPDLSRDPAKPRGVLLDDIL